MKPFLSRRLRPDLTWRQGDAAALPLPDAAFDVALCQSALMFVPYPTAALREMARVTVADGTVGVQIWASPDRQRGFRPLADAVAGTPARTRSTWSPPTFASATCRSSPGGASTPGSR